MKHIEKPIAFFDLETTGLNVATDRIVSIALKILLPDGEIDNKYRLIKPPIVIPDEVIEIHGITNEMVKNESTFAEIAKSLYELLCPCDLCGYNMINYDLPLLSEEFARCNLNFPVDQQRFLDAGVIFKTHERRNLETAFSFYCHKELKDAHDARADVDATYEVFLAQVDKYDDLGETISEIAEKCTDKRADLSNKLVYDEEGNVCYNFGKSKGKPVESDISFASWMLSKDFTLNTQFVLKKALTEKGYDVKMFDAQT